MTAEIDQRAFSVDGRLVFITGAVRGIGAAIVRRFAKAGAYVAFTYRATGRNEHFAAQLMESVEEGDRLLPLIADAADGVQTGAAVEQATDTFGKAVDIAIANAADTSKVPWREISIGEWDSMMATNLRGAFVLARAVADGMRSRSYGKIITVGSVMANIGDPRSLHYVTSKAGIVGFTRSLARAEGRNGIRVNCVIPGAIEVEKESDQGIDADQVLNWMQSVQCLMYRGQPEDIAAACHYLASHAGDFMTGQVLNVDGGWAHY